MDDDKLTEDKIIELVKKCDHVDDEMISYIRREGIDITVDEFFDSFDEINELGMFDNFNMVWGILYTVEEVNEYACEFGNYTFFLDFIDIKREYNIPYSVNIDFDRQIEQILNYGEITDSFTVLSKYLENISVETKLKIINEIGKKTYISSFDDLSNDALLELFRVAKDENIPVEIFKNCIKSKKDFIKKISYSDIDIIDYYSSIATEDEKKFIGIIDEIKNLPSVDDNLFKKMLERMPDDLNLRTSLATIAVRKGYRPKLQEIRNIPGYNKIFEDSVKYLFKDNLAYYPLLAPLHGYNSEEQREIIEELDMPAQRSAFKFLNKITSSFDKYYLIMYLSRVIINNYFDEYGCKKELLSELIERKESISSRTIMEVFNSCQEKLNQEEKSYYGLIVDLIDKKDREDIINEIGDGSCLKNPDFIISLLEKHCYDSSLIVSLVHNNLLNDNSLFKNNISMRIIVDITNQMLKGGTSKSSCEILIRKLFEDGKIDERYFDGERLTDEFFEFMIDNRKIQELLLLNEKYLTKIQHDFIDIVGDGITFFQGHLFWIL